MSHAASRRHGPDLPVARLDELFVVDDVPPARVPIQQRHPWLLSGALQTFIASAVVYTMLHVANFDLPYPLILAVCAGGVLVRKAVRQTVEPSWLRTADLVRPVMVRRRHEPGGWYEGGDGMLDAVRRWDRRLAWGIEGPDRFRHTVAGRLGEVVDERLRLRHGITRDSDPQKARALLGERVWALLGPIDRVPSHRQVQAALEDLEKV
jgi:hypothetical protein